MADDLLTLYKCTRADGTDFRTGTVDYASALTEGRTLTIDAEPPTGEVCGRGIHVCDTPRKTIRFADRGHGPWRWFEGATPASAVVERDGLKLRVRQFQPTRELTLEDLFGPDFGRHVQEARETAASWKNIPWLKPPAPVADAQIEALVGQWREALTPWLRSGGTLPATVRVVRTRNAAADAAVAAADAAADVADVAAADADAAADAAADDAAADAAVAAVAAAADAAAAALTKWLPYWWRWYIRPRHILWRSIRWLIAGLDRPSPWAPLVELYRLGCLPLGYCRSDDGVTVFVVYCPGGNDS